MLFMTSIVSDMVGFLHRLKLIVSRLPNNNVLEHLASSEQ